MTVFRTLSILLFVLPALSAHAEIYKCSGKKGMPVYQNFPCEIDSLGSSAALPSDAKLKTAKEATPPASTAIPENPATVAASARGARSVPHVGMTADQAKAIWGEPREKTKEEFAKGDIETWKYTDSRSIQFDHRRRVSAVAW
jgi:hypothetical protein